MEDRAGSVRPRISVLFVNHESWEELAGALLSLRRHPPSASRSEWEVIVVDNASRSLEGRARAEEILRELDGRLVLCESNPGYGAGMNVALSHARGALLLVCNPDLVFQPGCIAELARQLERDSSAGVATPDVFLDPGLTVRAPAHVLPTPRDLVLGTLAALSPRWNERYLRERTGAAVAEWQRTEPFEEIMLGGCCFLIRRELAADGLFDERYPLYFEDTDLARRLRARGAKIVRVPLARVVHLYGRSTVRASAHAAEAYRTSRRRYFRRWHGLRGALLRACVERFLRSSFARRRAAAMLARPVQALEGAVVELPRESKRFVVELCHDPLFLLAGGSFGSGRTWSLDAGILASLERPAWLRVVDLEGGEPRELGRFVHRPPPRPPFNRLLRSFEKERARPEFDAERRALADFVERARSAGIALRLDHDREWEHAHVLLALRRLGGVERVLDVGGGNGPLAYLLAERGHRVTMLDSDREAVARTRENARALGLARLEALQTGRSTWPVEPGSADAVVCVSVIEGVLRRDRDAFWHELRRALRPGGSALVTFDFGEDARFVGDPPLTVEEIERDLVRSSGLELAGAPIGAPPDFGEGGPPVRAVAVAADGAAREIAYTFGALHLVRPRGVG